MREFTTVLFYTPRVESSGCQLESRIQAMSLMKEQTPQQGHALREVFNGLRYGVRAGCFEAMAHDLRAVLRTVVERSPQPSAAIYDSRTLQSTPESGPRAAYDGYKRRKGSKVQIAVDTLGHLLALKVTPAYEQGASRRVDAGGP